MVPITAQTEYAKQIPEGCITNPKILTMLQENHDRLLLWAQALSLLITKNNRKTIHEPNTNTKFREYIPIAHNQ